MADEHCSDAPTAQTLLRGQGVIEACFHSASVRGSDPSPTLSASVINPTNTNTPLDNYAHADLRMGTITRVCVRALPAAAERDFSAFPGVCPCRESVQAGGVDLDGREQEWLLMRR